MSADRYTQEQILCGLRIFWREELRGDDSFDADTRIDHHLQQEGMWAEIDLSDVAEGVEYFFHFSCTPQEWQEFFGSPELQPGEWERRFAPQFTFGGLADFIRERVEVISLEPLTLLGKPCRTAGIFRGLERLAQQIEPQVHRFAPSTPIRVCLRRGSLHRFWNHLRWISEDQLPPPPRILLTFGGFLHSLWLKVTIGLLIALWTRDFLAVLAGVVVSFMLLIPLGMIVTFVNTVINPLPKPIQTFGDLARYLAVIADNQQPPGASCSTP